MSEEIERVVIRPAKNMSDDMALVHSTWKNQLWYSEKRNLSIVSDFYRQASREVNTILNQKDAVCKMACLANNPNALIGWSVMRGPHLEFVYVKRDYRGRGVGRLLTKGMETFSEPVTRIGKVLAERFNQEKRHGQEEKAGVDPVHHPRDGEAG